MFVKTDHRPRTPWVGQQPEVDKCWLAAFAMLDHWKNNTTFYSTSYSRKTLAEKLTKQGVTLPSTTIESPEIRTIAGALGFRVIAPTTPDAFGTLISHSPVAVFGEYAMTGNTTGKHVTVIYRANGDTSNAVFLYVRGWDPWTKHAERFKYDFDEFSQFVCKRQDHWVAL